MRSGWLLLVLAPLFMTAWALAAASLWGWFVVPLGLPPIGPLSATGLAVTGWFFWGAAYGYGFEPATQARPDRLVIGALGAFFFGWLVHFALASGW